jgi:hypothetical protein
VIKRYHSNKFKDYVSHFPPFCLTSVWERVADPPATPPSPSNPLTRCGVRINRDHQMLCNHGLQRGNVLGLSYSARRAYPLGSHRQTTMYWFRLSLCRLSTSLPSFSFFVHATERFHCPHLEDLWLNFCIIFSYSETRIEWCEIWRVFSSLSSWLFPRGVDCTVTSCSTTSRYTLPSFLIFRMTDLIDRRSPNHIAVLMNSG